MAKQSMYLVEAWGTCDEFDEGYGAWIEGQSLGTLEDLIEGTSTEARQRGNELKEIIATRADGKVRNVKINFTITKQRKRQALSKG